MIKGQSGVEADGSIAVARMAAIGASCPLPSVPPNVSCRIKQRALSQAAATAEAAPVVAIFPRRRNRLGSPTVVRLGDANVSTGNTRTAAQERPDRRVADAFRIEPSRDRRGRIVRDLAGEGSLRKQASAIRRKVRRYRAQSGDRAIAGERGLLWQLEQIGSLDLSERQIRRILGGR